MREFTPLSRPLSRTDSDHAERVFCRGSREDRTSNTRSRFNLESDLSRDSVPKVPRNSQKGRGPRAEEGAAELAPRERVRVPLDDVVVDRSTRRLRFPIRKRLSKNRTLSDARDLLAGSL